MDKALEIYAYTGEGYQPLVFTPNWMAAILNWEPKAERRNMHAIERHNRSDEVFVLLRGKSVLFVRREGEPLEAYDLEPGVIYNVPKGVWHNLIASQDSSFLIVENSGTHLEDTELRPITAEELAQVDAQLPAWIKA